jgi:hypothetical protein
MKRIIYKPKRIRLPFKVSPEIVALFPNALTFAKDDKKREVKQ